jgi:N-acetylglucosaminyldiphosphoundecaprenol N-acetyl-beta-D-mannosaminyltransferase
VLAAEATKAISRRVEVLGCAVDVVTMAEAVERAEQAIHTRETCQHVAINAAKLVKYQHDETLRSALDGCELATADGQAVVWASRLLGRPLPERVAGIDLMEALLHVAGAKGYRVFLLGARPAVVDRARQDIVTRFPELVVAGSHHGYFRTDEEDEVVALVAAAAPDILFVALETPAKELFLARNRARLGIPFVMGVGGALDVLAGERRRAPEAFQRLGLEWLFRLSQDPRRLARRYVVGNAKFIWLVLLELARTRGKTSPPSAQGM